MSAGTVLDGNSTDGADGGGSFSDYLKGLETLATTANSLYSGIGGGTPKPATPKPATPPAKPLAAATVSSKLVAYLPWIIGGGIALVALVLLMGKRK